MGRGRLIAGVFGEISSHISMVLSGNCELALSLSSKFLIIRAASVIRAACFSEGLSMHECIRRLEEDLGVMHASTALRLLITSLMLVNGGDVPDEYVSRLLNDCIDLYAAYSRNNEFTLPSSK